MKLERKEENYEKIAAIFVGVVLAVWVLLMVIPSDEESDYMEEATTGEEASMIGSAGTAGKTQDKLAVTYEQLEDYDVSCWYTLLDIYQQELYTETIEYTSEK